MLVIEGIEYVGITRVTFAVKNALRRKWGSVVTSIFLSKGGLSSMNVSPSTGVAENSWAQCQASRVRECEDLIGPVSRDSELRYSAHRS